MTNFYISDNHFLHNNIFEKFTPSSRPFKTGDEMTEHMIASWNSVVPENGDVWNLGDFCFGKGSTLEEAEKIFARLNGRKHLIIGNHEDIGLKLPWNSISPYREHRENGIKVVLFHFPIEDWSGRYRGSVHFHGHVHSTPEKPYRYMENRYDVGVDAIGFKPLTFQQVIDFYGSKEQVSP